MNDYKALIAELRFLSSIVPEDMCDSDGKDALEKAAAAIETLLAERDAAVEMLRGECRACKHNSVWHNVGKCCTCTHETAGALIPKDQCTDNWEWKGI